MVKNQPAKILRFLMPDRNNISLNNEIYYTKFNIYNFTITAHYRK